ncbi:MAG: XdhC/CoxI family protein, partial [Ferruginibacter sp.]|nr:XdhC/CoxI family protein [Ferruginibacter sp.]
GFKMAVAADASICGTIGGGIMEYKFVEMAKATLQQSLSQPKLYKQVHDKTSGKNQSGMICSGEQTIFIHQIKQQDIFAINELLISEKNYKNGTLQLNNSGILFFNEIPQNNFEYLFTEIEFSLKEKTGFKNVLHIIGGGHCALSLSRIMSEMDFFIHVYDERKNLNTMEQNVFAHAKEIVSSFADIHSKIESGENIYVVIMTFGYRTDDIALRAIIHKKLKYLGIMGSKKKMEKLFNDYRDEKISSALLEKLHTPIGISIKSQTTAEIAVSIAAEIISVKNA